MRKKKLLVAAVVGTLVSLLGVAMLVAHLTEPRGLVGAAHAAHPAVVEYAEAEERLFDQLGVPSTSRMLMLGSLGIRTHVREVPGEGPPIVMVHGGGSSLIAWAPLAAELRGRHLFLIDRPGCGQTDGFEYADEIDLRQHAVSFLAAVLDKLKLMRASLVGNSMGGLWSIWFTLAHPERVESLALVGCPAMWPATSGSLPMRVMGRPGLGALMMRMQPSGPEAARKMLARVAGARAAARVTAELVRAAQAMRKIPGVSTSFRTLVQQSLTLGGASPRYALTVDQLQALPLPVLLVWGSEDVFGAVDVAQRGIANAPRFRLKVVEGGHLPWLDDPQQVADSIGRFLDEPKHAANDVAAAQP